jgi:predicted MPP superfamily phosphohydrolase
MLLRMLLFLLIVLALVAGVHFYFWARLVRDTQLPFPYRAWASGAILALAACIPLAFLLGRRLSPALAGLVVWPAYVWIGLMFLLLLTLLTTDLVRLSLHVGRAVAGAAPDPARRVFLARVLGAAAGLVTGGLGLVAVKAGLGRLAVKEVRVRLRRLPAAQHGTTIVQLTDVHVGPTIGRAFVESLVQQVNALTPDVVAITGDLVDGSVEDLWDAVAPLGGLRARHGIYFVTGNHEYFSGAGPWIDALGRLGIRVLANERVTIGDSGAQEAATGFDLAGVHDYSAGRLDPLHRPDLPRALEGRDPARELVLLAHQPRAVEEASRHGVGLVLSGHTHGGQIWPFSYLVKLQQPYVVGLHRHGETDTQIYVSPGTGYWGPPMRLGTRPEITRVVLECTT